MILLRKVLSLETQNVYVNGDGRRAIALSISCDSNCYLILNVYAPTKPVDKRTFFRNLLTWFNKIKKSGDLIVCGGDWNITQSATLDTRGVHKPPQSFRHFIRKNKLLDVWRKMHPTRNSLLGVKTSYRYILKIRLLAYIIDFISVSLLLRRPALKCDHNAISLKLKILVVQPEGKVTGNLTMPSYSMILLQVVLKIWLGK